TTRCEAVRSSVTRDLAVVLQHRSVTASPITPIPAFRLCAETRPPVLAALPAVEECRPALPTIAVRMEGVLEVAGPAPETLIPRVSSLPKRYGFQPGHWLPLSTAAPLLLCRGVPTGPPSRLRA